MNYPLLLTGTLLQIAAAVVPAFWALRRQGTPATWGEVENPPSPPILTTLTLAVLGIVLVTVAAMLA